MSHKTLIPVWFFIGVLLFVYGLIVFFTGIEELSSPPPTVMSNYHSAVWWGILLVLIGSLYTYKFWPRRRK